MNEYSRNSIQSYLEGVSSWENAYKYARLLYLALEGDQYSIISARLYLDIRPVDSKPEFNTGNIRAGQVEIPLENITVEKIIHDLLSNDGLIVEGYKPFILAKDLDKEYSVSSPIFLHHEGISNGNRLAVLLVNGGQRGNHLHQPETDWMLRSGNNPYDSLNELNLDYGLSTSTRDDTLLEIIATCAVQIYAKSEVKGTKAKIGIYMAKSLEKNACHIGLRVMDQPKGNVVDRYTLQGSTLTWTEDDIAAFGICEIEIPAGALIQCFACYKGVTHNAYWLADPDIFFNPRNSVLSFIDPNLKLLKSYLKPEASAKGRVADDFEAAISWLLWSLGFSPANFGLNNKTTDLFDTIAVTPLGDFLVIECTTGLLRAESKLSKLVARTASLRKSLDASNMANIRILSIIVTALPLEHIKADLAQAEDTGILVVTMEDLDELFDELIRFPDPDKLFNRGMQKVKDNLNKNANLFPMLNA